MARLRPCQARKPGVPYVSLSRLTRAFNWDSCEIDPLNVRMMSGFRRFEYAPQSTDGKFVGYPDGIATPWACGLLRLPLKGNPACRNSSNESGELQAVSGSLPRSPSI